MFIRGGSRNTYFEENGFKRDAKCCLIYTNEELMKKQRGVLTHFIKQMGSNWLKSKPLTQISLPVKVFDSKSFLEKCALFFKTAPIFLE